MSPDENFMENLENLQENVGKICCFDLLQNLNYKQMSYVMNKTNLKIMMLD